MITFRFLLPECAASRAAYLLALPVLVLGLGLGLTGCDREEPVAPANPVLDPDAEFDPSKQVLIYHLNAGQAAKLLQRHPDTFILDIRPYDAYQAGHLAGAVSKPLEDEDFEHYIMDQDRTRRILIYDEDGLNNIHAVMICRAHLFHDIYQIDGGVQAWMREGLPLETGPGEKGVASPRDPVTGLPFDHPALTGEPVEEEDGKRKGKDKGEGEGEESKDTGTKAEPPAGTEAP